MKNTNLHVLYEERLRAALASSFDKIRSVAVSLLLERYDESTRNGFYNDLKRGEAVIDREELLWQYLWSFGLMHQGKMNMALDRLPGLREIVGNGFSVIDWGCGQGLATVCLLDYLKGRGVEAVPDRTVLIEPSELAIENARLHVGLYGIDHPRIVRKYLDDVDETDIETDSPSTIHLFSNILDMKGFDLRRLAHLIGDNATGRHFFVCVSPLNGREQRLDAFKGYFVDTVDLASEASSLNHMSVIAEETLGRGQGNNFTIRLIIFEFVAGTSSVVQVDYYPPVQFFAAYQLDSMTAASRKEAASDVTLRSSFEVAAPFELGGHVYDDVHPVLAVLNNIVTRGLPTKCSPFMEQAFAPYGENALPERLGEISFSARPSDDESVRLLQERTPLGVARVQKTILEAIICGRLRLDAREWHVLVRERDVPCAALAFEDLSQMFAHLTAMTKDYGAMAMPEVRLTIIGTETWADSPLHLEAHVRQEAGDELRMKRYDMVIDVSTCAPIEVASLGFSEFKAKNGCYFVIGSSERIRSARKIYTSDAITYLPLGSTNQSGVFEENHEVVGHLTYFLNLLFRKREFRPGQVPILSRALQNKNVIGLLPTGGGKSLTYQLAALLQPGVTIVVDPLRSLMQDQWSGLIEAGIDACAYINSTISKAENRVAEGRMESSELQFVFLSPERLCIYEFRERLRTMHEMNVYFSYGVIDEVHCVSEWGHDFRFSYLHLGRNMYQFVHAKDPDRRLTLFGLTATASFDVLADVERELSGDGAYPLDANTIVRYENTDRLELQYKVDRVPIEFADERYLNLGSGLPKPRYISRWRANDCKSDYLATHIFDMPAEVEELQADESIERIRRRFVERQNVSEVVVDEPLGNGDVSGMLAKRERYDQAAIVFCPHRKSTGVSVDVNRGALAGMVPDIGTFVGSSDDDRERDEESFENLRRFKNDEQPLMIATKAFGMGIDKPNVRFTVNMNYPSSLESFVQEAGRAGRDRRISLATILVGDYRLARVSPDCPITAKPIPSIRGRWYNESDLHEVLGRFGVDVPVHFIDVATPEDDWVMAECSEGAAGYSREERDRRRGMFTCGRCDLSCRDYGECRLRYLPDRMRGWHKLEEIEGEFDRLRIPKTNLAYLNADYGNNMYFYNSSFLGERAEKKALHEVFCKTPTEVFVGNVAERAETYVVPNLMDAVLSLDANRGQEMVAFVDYPERKSDGGRGYSSTQKAIYRMCCIGFVDDFTQDYVKKQFRLVMKRKPDGAYYDGLRRFLSRYYADERAEELVAKVPGYRGDNEVQKCLGFLTDFIYSKVAVKRKRALDDVRTFCAMGANSRKDWKETNEDLKDLIYYYFNSKYAREEYATDSGEPFSLTIDTDWGKVGSTDVALKYLRVVDDDLVGAGGTPIDNVKHLQGAVRLIRRSLTDGNPCLELLNYFCLTQLGTNDSDALERELFESYRAGMTGFSERIESREKFWKFKQLFDEMVEEAPHRYDLLKIKPLQDELTAQIHLGYLREIRRSYVGYKRRWFHHGQ